MLFNFVNFVNSQLLTYLSRKGELYLTGTSIDLFPSVDDKLNVGAASHSHVHVNNTRSLMTM